MSPSDDANDTHLTRVNGYELALWVFGAVAVAAAVWGDQWANSTLSLANGGYYCDDVGNCTERYDFVLTQTILSLAPALLVAGLIAVIAALALRAVAVMLRRPNRVTPSSHPVATAEGRDRFMRPSGQ
jgi:hypothetical protein